MIMIDSCGTVHWNCTCTVITCRCTVIITWRCRGITAHGSGYILIGKFLGRYYLAKWVHIR